MTPGEELRSILGMKSQPVKEPHRKSKSHMSGNKTAIRQKFEGLRDEIRAYIRDGHTKRAAADKFGFSATTLGKYLMGNETLRVYHTVRSSEHLAFPRMARLPELIVGDTYKIISSASAGYCADDSASMEFVGVFAAPHATGGRLFLFRSTGGWLESYTEYQVRTCVYDNRRRGKRSALIKESEAA